MTNTDKNEYLHLRKDYEVKSNYTVTVSSFSIQPFSSKQNITVFFEHILAYRKLFINLVNIIVLFIFLKCVVNIKLKEDNFFLSFFFFLSEIKLNYF